MSPDSTGAEIGRSTGVAVPSPGSPAQAIGLNRVAWLPADELPLSAWVEVGRRLGAIGRGVAWWIGDWVNYGNVRYGQKYTRAARITGYDRQTLMNMALVASRFELGRRRPSLSWSHHAAVVGLPSAEQDAWLDRAVKDRLAVHCLREEMRAERRPRVASGAAVAVVGGDRRAPARGGGGEHVCPRCGYRFGADARA